MNGIELCCATVHQIDKTSRGGHDNLHSLTQSADLRFDVRAAIYWQDAHVGEVFGKGFQVIGNLQAELAGRGEDDGGRCNIYCKFLQQRQSVGCCLTCSRLRQGYQVLFTGELVGDDSFLNRHGCFEAEFCDGL